MHHVKIRWHAEQGRAGGEEAGADHGAAERPHLAEASTAIGIMPGHTRSDVMSMAEAGVVPDLDRGRDRVSAVR